MTQNNKPTITLCRQFVLAPVRRRPTTLSILFFFRQLKRKRLCIELHPRGDAGPPVWALLCVRGRPACQLLPLVGLFQLVLLSPLLVLRLQRLSRSPTAEPPREHADDDGDENHAGCGSAGNDAHGRRGGMAFCVPAAAAVDDCCVRRPAPTIRIGRAEAGDDGAARVNRNEVLGGGRVGGPEGELAGVLVDVQIGGGEELPAELGQLGGLGALQRVYDEVGCGVVDEDAAGGLVDLRVGAHELVVGDADAEAGLEFDGEVAVVSAGLVGGKEEAKKKKEKGKRKKRPRKEERKKVEKSKNLRLISCRLVAHVPVVDAQGPPHAVDVVLGQIHHGGKVGVERQAHERRQPRRQAGSHGGGMRRRRREEAGVGAVGKVEDNIGDGDDHLRGALGLGGRQRLHEGRAAGDLGAVVAAKDDAAVELASGTAGDGAAPKVRVAAGRNTPRRPERVEQRRVGAQADGHHGRVRLDAPVAEGDPHWQGVHGDVGIEAQGVGHTRHLRVREPALNSVGGAVVGVGGQVRRRARRRGQQVVGSAAERCAAGVGPRARVGAARQAMAVGAVEKSAVERPGGVSRRCRRDGQSWRRGLPQRKKGGRLGRLANGHVHAPCDHAVGQRDVAEPDGNGIRSTRHAVSRRGSSGSLAGESDELHVGICARWHRMEETSKVAGRREEGDAR